MVPRAQTPRCARNCARDTMGSLLGGVLPERDALVRNCAWLFSRDVAGDSRAGPACGGLVERPIVGPPAPCGAYIYSSRDGTPGARRTLKTGYCDR